MSDLCEFEIEVLESLADIRPPIPWGAALGAALESLKGLGYVKLVSVHYGAEYQITEDGMNYLLDMNP